MGFTLPEDSLKPEEGHLVLKGPDISGNVTSCEYSPTVGMIIGLAYVSISQSDIGERFPIRVEGGEIVHGKVIALPFFDPDNLRRRYDNEYNYS